MRRSSDRYLKDGKTAVFTVSRVARFSKWRYPTRAVYARIDHAGLRLITCGGTTQPDTATWTTSSCSPDWRRCADLVADQTRSALDHQHKGFGRQAGAGV